MQAHVRSLLAALALVGSLALPSALEAQVPRTMTVQGVLRDAAGVPVDQATQFRFELLDGGTSLWLESRSVTPRAGLFTVTLGTDTPIDPAFFDRGVSLRVTVDGESMDPIPLTSVPYAFRAETAERFDGDVSWGQITDVPSGFADGTDDGTTYEAGFGLSLTGSRFAADTTEVQARVSVGCPMGQSISAIGADGSVTCETDDVGAAGTTYTAGAGLVLTGTTFAVDPSVVQGRVSGVCPVGQAIRAIDAMGMVSCQPATTYTAGAGLSLAGTTFATDFAAVQARVSGTCPAGQAIRAIDGMGSVTCQASTSYAAGTGLTLTGSTFSVDTSAIQARVSGTCPSGQAIRGVNADGTVVCQAAATTSPAGLSLVGWFELDEMTGPSFADSSGQGNTATSPGSGIAPGSLGRIGRAVSFTGGVLTVAAPSLPRAPTLAVEAWIQPQAPITGTDAIVARPGAWALKQVGSELRMEVVGTTSATACTVTTAGLGLTAGTWVRAAGAYDGLHVSISANGVVLGSAACPNGAVAQPASPGPMYIGGLGGGIEPFNGTIDDVAIRLGPSSPTRARYVSEWRSVTNSGTVVSFTHGLGATPSRCEAYWSTTATGANRRPLSPFTYDCYIGGGGPFWNGVDLLIDGTTASFSPYSGGYVFCYYDQGRDSWFGANTAFVQMVCEL